MSLAEAIMSILYVFCCNRDNCNWVANAVIESKTLGVGKTTLAETALKGNRRPRAGEKHAQFLELFKVQIMAEILSILTHQ